MSQNTARVLRQPAPTRAPEATAPRLRVIEGTRGAGRRTVLPLLLVVFVVVMLAIVAPLVVNTNMAQTSYEIRDQQVALSEQRALIETLEAKLLLAQSPDNLREKAAEIGMVPAAPVGVVSLEKREITGGNPAQ